MLEAGDVVKGFVKDVEPPKKKYCVCINPLERLFFLINTENRRHYDCIEISSQSYEFLNGLNRYISCSRSFYIPKQNQKEKVLGKIMPGDLKKIVEQIHLSKRLAPNVKPKLLKYLPQTEKIKVL